MSKPTLLQHLLERYDGVGILLIRKPGDDTLDVLEQYNPAMVYRGFGDIPSLSTRTYEAPVVLNKIEDLFNPNRDFHVGYEPMHVISELKRILDTRTRPYPLVMVTTSQRDIPQAIQSRCYIYERNSEPMLPVKAKPGTLFAVPEKKPAHVEIGEILDESKFALTKPTYEELTECIQNLMGAFDTPIARRKVSGEFPDQVRLEGRNILWRIEQNKQ